MGLLMLVSLLVTAGLWHSANLRYQKQKRLVEFGNRVYGSDRHLAGTKAALEVGICEVSIPPDHRSEFYHPSIFDSSGYPWFMPSRGRRFRSGTTVDCRMLPEVWDGAREWIHWELPFSAVRSVRDFGAVHIRRDGKLRTGRCATRMRKLLAKRMMF